jgi:Tfp pilus assembly protein PilZ
MTDRRTRQRFGPSVIKTRFESEGERREGYLTNVSGGGAFLAVEKPPRLGEDIELSAILPWRLGELRARARVVWRSQSKLGGAGLAFTRLDSSARALLDAYLVRFAELAASIDEPDDIVDSRQSTVDRKT